MGEPVQAVDTLPRCLPLVEQLGVHMRVGDAASRGEGLLGVFKAFLELRAERERINNMRRALSFILHSGEILRDGPLGMAMSWWRCGGDADGSRRVTAARRWNFESRILTVVSCTLLLAATVPQVASLSYVNRLDSFNNVSLEEMALASELAANGFFASSLKSSGISCVMPSRISCMTTDGCTTSSGVTAACIECIACHRSPGQGHAEDCLYSRLLRALRSTTSTDLPDGAVDEPRLADWRRLWRWLRENPGSFVVESLGYPRAAVVLAACRLFCRSAPDRRGLETWRAGDIVKEIQESGMDSMESGMVDVEPILAVIADR